MITLKIGTSERIDGDIIVQ